MSFRNRCVVSGSNNLVHLSVPLEKGRDHKQLMKDTRINYSGRWQTEHMRTLESCYARSPFYEYYSEEVRNLIEKKDVFLIDKNMAILEWLTKKLELTAVVSGTDTYMDHYPVSVADLRNQILPKNYMQYPMPFTYMQVFSDRLGFQPNLCILDLLFCTGPEAKKMLRKGIAEK